MKIHEYQAKEIFSKYGIPVERHTLCRTAAGVVAAYRSVGADRVVIKAQVYRSQELNREAALARLVAVIKDLTTEQKARRPTRPTRASKERRLASKAQKSSVKAMRGKVRSGRE